MQKKILITGATDGIGLATAKLLAAKGHTLLIHGRSKEKLAKAKELIAAIPGAGVIECYKADLSVISEVHELAEMVVKKFNKLDVLINNAGVLKTNNPITSEGLDVRFMVNTIAPYILSTKLHILLKKSGRIINLSSAAQAPVNIQALLGKVELSAMEAYAQSKLAITMWSKALAEKVLDEGITVIAVNPGSLLASKMVKEGFGVEGKDINIGANILVRMALDDDISSHSGEYFDNDIGRFVSSSNDVTYSEQSHEIIKTIEMLSEQL